MNLLPSETPVKRKILKKFLIKGDVYAVQAGDYMGELIFFMEKKEDFYFFLAAPKMEIRRVPIDKFDIGVEMGLLEYVKNLPKFVYDVVERQYNEISE